MRRAARELVGAALGDIEIDARGDHWPTVVGKQHKVAKVALPPLARTALNRHLVKRRLPVTSSRWRPDMPLIASLAEDSAARFTSVRLWNVLQRYRSVFILVRTIASPYSIVLRPSRVVSCVYDLT